VGAPRRACAQTDRASNLRTMRTRRGAPVVKEGHLAARVVIQIRHLAIRGSLPVAVVVALVVVLSFRANIGRRRRRRVEIAQRDQTSWRSSLTCALSHLQENLDGSSSRQFMYLLTTFAAAPLYVDVFPRERVL